MLLVRFRSGIEIAGQIARGLAAAHDNGLVHRDLKPGNVFLLKDGQVKILDFGLAKPMTRSAMDGETIAATDPGTVLGTVGYMAPEQVRGEAVDGRADLFALGAVLYEMLSGRRAFQRDTPAETMTAILKEDPPALAADRADLPPALEAVVRHCLERNMAERFQSARDLAFNLQSASHASGSGPSAAVKGIRASVSRREAIAWTLAALLSIAAGLALVAPWRPAAPATKTAPAARFQINAPDKSAWAAPLGAPDGSNGGTISPDGTMVAFVAAESSGKPLLYVRPIDSFAARVVPGTEGASFPFWSADSRQLGFFTQTRLKRVPAAGGPAQTVAELSSTPRGGTWNAGGIILFATAGSGILRVPAEGGQPTPVTRTTADNAAHQWPAFLPDGQHFLYYSASVHALFAGSLAGGTEKRLLPADSNAVFVPPNQLVFIQEGTLLARDFDVTRLEPLGESRSIADRIAWTAAPWNLGAFSASASGTLTYRLGGGNHSQFAWFDRAGQELATVGDLRHDQQQAADSLPGVCGRQVSDVLRRHRRPDGVRRLCAAADSRLAKAGARRAGSPQ